MKSIILFPISLWNKKQILSFLDANSIDADLRYGFSHILAVSLNKVDFGVLTSSKNIFCLHFSKGKHIASKDLVEIKRKFKNVIPLEEALKKPNNLEFDLINFGYIPLGRANSESLYKLIRSSKLSEKIDILASSSCDEVMKSRNVPEKVKKILLDAFVLRAVSILGCIRLHQKDILSQYSELFVLSCATRAMIEKLILLISEIDKNIDFKRVDTSKSRKRTFLKLSERSTNKITKEFRGFIINVELLDNHYRTPEVHKMGRVLGLVHNGYFQSLLNEVLSFQNQTNHYLIRVRDFVKKIYNS